MDVADMLIDKIVSWVELQKDCAEMLNKLAAELEKHKKKVNMSQVSGSVGSVVGAVAMTAAGIAAIFTGGLATPVIAAAGATISGLGFATNLGSEVVNAIISSCTMDEANKIEEKTENLEKGIQKLMETLKKEGEKREQKAASCADVSPNDYVTERILRAMAKCNRLELHEDISLTNMMSSFSKRKTAGEEMALGIPKKSALGLPLLSKFVMQAAAKKSGKTLMSKLLPGLVTKVGPEAAAKAVGRIAGGAAGLVVSVPELITNCINLAECETEASQSLKKNAEVIRTTSEELEKELDEIQKAFQRLAGIIASIENTKRSSSEKETLIEFALENCQDETVQQWIRENSKEDTFYNLVDMFHFLKAKINEEENKNHSNNINITFVAHGAITDSMIPASCLLPLPTISGVLLYSPWNCYLSVDAAYDVATGLMKPENRDFLCSGENCQCAAKKHWPVNLPTQWNSMKKAGAKKVPNIILSPVKTPGDSAWEGFELLPNKHGPPGRNHIIIPYILPGGKTSGSSGIVPFSIVTLALSLVVIFSRFQATIHLTACLGKMSASQKLDEEYVKEQYACTIDNTEMTSSCSDLARAVCSTDLQDVKLISILKRIFGLTSSTPTLLPHSA